jgi:hypothetical protein
MFTLCALTLEMFNCYQEHNISCVTLCVSGIDNMSPDTLYKLVWHRIMSSFSGCQAIVPFGRRTYYRIVRLRRKHSLSDLHLCCSDYKTCHVDTLTLDWSNLFVYAFPSIAVILLVARKFPREGSEMVLLTQLWPRGPWLTAIFSFSQRRSSLTSTQGRSSNYRRRQLRLFWLPNYKQLIKSMTHTETIMFHGVGDMLLISFQVCLKHIALPWVLFRQESLCHWGCTWQGSYCCCISRSSSFTRLVPPSLDSGL